MSPKKTYSRYAFLRKVGFQGPALMALLAACTREGDSDVDALILNKDGIKVNALDSTKAASSGTTSNGSSTSTGSNPGGSTAAGNVKPTGLVSTEVLNTITSYLAKIDLASNAASALKNIGGYVILSNTYVVGRSQDGAYVAASNLCTHEPKRRVIFNKSEYYCTDHGARFSLSGLGLNSLGNRGLTVFKTAYDGKTLLIFQ